jgi:hypothetical protein
VLLSFSLPVGIEGKKHGFKFLHSCYFTETLLIDWSLNGSLHVFIDEIHEISMGEGYLLRLYWSFAPANTHDNNFVCVLLPLVSMTTIFLFSLWSAWFLIDHYKEPISIMPVFKVDMWVLLHTRNFFKLFRSSSNYTFLWGDILSSINPHLQ